MVGEFTGFGVLKAVFKHVYKNTPKVDFVQTNHGWKRAYFSRKGITSASCLLSVLLLNPAPVFISTGEMSSHTLTAI